MIIKDGLLNTSMKNSGGWVKIFFSILIFALGVW